MKKVTPILGILILAAGSLATRAKADSTPVTFAVTGTYANGTASTPLSQGGQDFTMSFLVPTQPGSMIDSIMAGDDFYLYPMNVHYSLGGVNTVLTNALVSFYTSTAGTQSGGFFVDYCATDPTCATGLEYQWTFAGPQLYCDSEMYPTLLPADFSFSNQPFTVYSNSTTEWDSTISGGVTAATPEPSSMAMLLVGAAFAIFLLRKTQLSV